MTVLDLSGRKALVVGGGQGIGEATARLLARAGSAVAILDEIDARAREVQDALQQEGATAFGLAADVTNADAAARAVSDAATALGGLDAVVNIVGSASWGSLLDMDEETWERDFTLNLKHHWYVSRAAARYWHDADTGGAICVVGSVSGLWSAANHAAYGAAKAGLSSFVKSAAEEWWPQRIRVNAVVPGAVRTPRIEAAWADGSIPQPKPDTLDRMSMPEDIAGTALFLVSDLARGITGQSVIVDSGTTTKFPFDLG